jgi:hypothetical protein
MSSVVISGDTSGSITLQAPAVSGSTTLTLPATTATLATLTTPSFASTIGVGGATASASGAGITFPTTQSASSNANTLDDYEEGTWTPTVFIGATEVTSYHFQNGSYTRVGRIVHANCWVRVNNKGAGTGVVSIRGLPFNIAGGNSSYTAGTVGYIDEVLSSSAPMYCFGNINTANVSLAYGSATGLVDVTQANLNNGQFMIQISYPTAT